MKTFEPMPTLLVMTYQAKLIKVIRNIANISQKARILPQSVKSVPLKPLITKSNLDCKVLPNYRSVSNLSFLSKTIAVASQLSIYLLVNKLSETQ